MGFRVNALRDETCGLHSTCWKSPGSARDRQDLHTRVAGFSDWRLGWLPRRVAHGWS